MIYCLFYEYQVSDLSRPHALPKSKTLVFVNCFTVIFARGSSYAYFISYSKSCPEHD